MKCYQCQQHNPTISETCWNCGESLMPEVEAAQPQPVVEKPVRQPPAKPRVETNDASELGVLGPLRPGQGADHTHAVMRRSPKEDSIMTRSSRRLLARCTVGGALTAGAVLGLVFGLITASNADFLQAAKIPISAGLFVAISQGFMLGAGQGAIIGALTSYYGGGMWTGAKIGAALATGLWLVNTLMTGSIAVLTPTAIATTVAVLILVGGAIGGLVGATADALAPPN